MKPVWLSVFALTVIASTISGHTQNKRKAPATTQAAKSSSIDPLESFKVQVKNFGDFFGGTGHKAVSSQDFPDSPSGRLFQVEHFTGEGLAYDVSKTDSLVSPYTGFITINLTEEDNSECGNVTGRGEKTVYGWSTLLGALSAADRSSCFHSRRYHGAVDVTPVKFTFAFQDNHWVYQGAIRTEFSKEDTFLDSIITAKQLEPMTQFSDPAAQLMNAPWHKLVEPVS